MPGSHICVTLTFLFVAVEGSVFLPTRVDISGCADGSSEGLGDLRHPSLSACKGRWEGHIRNASSLCAQGWQVCSAFNEFLLRTINWTDATSQEGCFAFNAAQDGGHCRPCINDLEQDDLAAIGHGCPHQTYGQESCVSGGQISASCCVDTHYKRACEYRPGIADGILCCRKPGVLPQILVKPQPLTHVRTSVTFVLSCQALGSPTPKVVWTKDGAPIPKNTRISVFESGYLLLAGVKVSDSGTYTCTVSNSVGMDTAQAKVVVTEYESGCADGTSDGLHQYEYIQACGGRWQGHVKRGKALCKRGWRVCSARNTNLINLLTWTDATELEGCYAYNAANVLNRCSRCHRSDLAGIGKNCGKIRPKSKSCLAEGRIDVYRGSIRAHDGCAYREGHTTGVLCCKRKAGNTVSWSKPAKCRPKCSNGGICEPGGRCRCRAGYKGAWCQNPICPEGCKGNSICVKPGLCQCKHGYTGSACMERKKICKHPCLNGGRCDDGKCKCVKPHHGIYCQDTKWNKISEMNRTEK